MKKDARPKKGRVEESQKRSPRNAPRSATRSTRSTTRYAAERLGEDVEKSRFSESALSLLQDYTHNCQTTYNSRWVYDASAFLNTDWRQWNFDPKKCVERYSPRRRSPKKISAPNQTEDNRLKQFRVSSKVHKNLEDRQDREDREDRQDRQDRQDRKDRQDREDRKDREDRQDRKDRQERDSAASPRQVSEDFARVNSKDNLEMRKRIEKVAEKMEMSVSEGFLDAVMNPLQTQDVLRRYLETFNDKEFHNEIFSPRMPPTSCGYSNEPKTMKLHQVGVWLLMRAWAKRQGQLFDALQTPKGMLVYHSTGSGKTCLASAVMESFWDQKTKAGPRTILVITTPSNRDDIKSGDKSKNEEEANKYWSCIKDMFPARFPSDKIGEFKKRVGDIMSFVTAGNQLKKSAEFREKFRNAVIIVDEAHKVLAASGSWRESWEYFAKTLLDDEATKNSTIILTTATPGESMGDLIKLLNISRRKSEHLQLTDYYDGATKSARNLDALRLKLAGRVSFVDFRNNTNDYPELLTETKTVDMSPQQFREWADRRRKDKISFDSAAGIRNENLRKLSNMAKPSPSSGLFKELAGGNTLASKEIYASGNFDVLSKYSPKVAEVVRTIERHITTGKQYLYSAFKWGGTEQTSLFLAGRGWTDVSDQLGSICEKLNKYNKTKSAADEKDLEGALRSLKGEPYKRFVTTHNWSDATKASGGKGGGGCRKQNVANLSVFDCEWNMRGEFVNLLIATGSFNEGLDLKDVRLVHILEPLRSVAQEDQTTGRARRMCSHSRLTKQNQNVTVVHYFSEAPQRSESIELEARLNLLKKEAGVVDSKIREMRARMFALLGDQGASILDWREQARGMKGGNWFTDLFLGSSPDKITTDDVQRAFFREEQLRDKLKKLAPGQAPLALELQYDRAKARSAVLRELKSSASPTKAQITKISKTEAFQEFSKLRAAEEELIDVAARLHGEVSKLSAMLDKKRKEEGPHYGLSGDDETSDNLVHNLARREFAPMNQMLQAVKDSAVDCKVLQNLHKFLGVNVHCKV